MNERGFQKRSPSWSGERKFGNGYGRAYIVCPEVKGNLVKHLREQHNCYVYAFGDSPLDINMLREAEKSIIVVGDVESRSKSMDGVLSTNFYLQTLPKDTVQILMTKNATPRLDEKL